MFLDQTDLGNRPRNDPSGIQLTWFSDKRRVAPFRRSQPSGPSGEATMPLARVLGQFFVALTDPRNRRRGRLCLKQMLRI
jgi:hypothetical protein